MIFTITCVLGILAALGVTIYFLSGKSPADPKD